jgi:hypothetical protein
LPSVIFSGNYVKALKAGLNLFNNATIWSGNIDPSTTGFAAPVADIFISTLTSTVYQKQGALDTNWVALASGSSPIVELRVITAGEETAKQLTLISTPASAPATIMEIAGAPSQFYGDDYNVSGAVLSWSGLGLDGILAAGDKLTISYNI